MAGGLSGPVVHAEPAWEAGECGAASGSSERTLALKMMQSETTLEKAEVVKQEKLAVSMMPEGLLMALSEEQRRDLMAYLMHPSQVD